MKGKLMILSMVIGFTSIAGPNVAYASGVGNLIGSTNVNPTISTLGTSTMGASTAGMSIGAGNGNPQGYNLGTKTDSPVLSGLNTAYRQEYTSTLQMISNPNYTYSSSTRAFVLAVTVNSYVNNSSGQLSTNQNSGGFVPYLNSVNPGLNVVTDNNGTITVTQSGTQAIATALSGNASLQNTSNANCTSQTVLTSRANSRFDFAYTTQTVCKPNTAVQPVGGGAANPPGPAQNNPVPVYLADGVTQGSGSQQQITQGTGQMGQGLSTGH